MSCSRPLSDMQESMMAHEEIAGRPVYNVPLCFSMTGDVDVAAVERAFGVVARRHPILLSTYHMDTGSVLVGAAPPPELRRGSWRPDEGPLPPLLADLWQRPFDLDEEPPVRIALASTESGQHLLGLCVHHVACDTWSVDLLLRDLGVAYNALRQGGTPRWAEDAPSFFDYSEQERSQEWDTTWWSRLLAGTRPQRYPRTDAPPEDHRGRAHRSELSLGAAQTQGVRRLARAARVSPAAVLLTAVSLTVGTGGPEHDSLVGLPAVLRDTGALQRTVGPLLNILPVAIGWRAGTSEVELVRQHATAMETSIQHKHVPYSHILGARSVSSAPRSAPLFLHVVNVDPDVPRLGLGGLRVTSVPVQPIWATWPALWEFSWPTVGNLRGELFVSTDAFTPGQAQALADGFVARLGWLLDGDG